MHRILSVEVMMHVTALVELIREKIASDNELPRQREFLLFGIYRRITLGIERQYSQLPRSLFLGHRQLPRTKNGVLRIKVVAEVSYTHDLLPRR